MSRRMKGYSYTIAGNVRALRQPFNACLGAQSFLQHESSRFRSEITPGADTCVVGMRMGDNCKIYRLPWIDVKVALLAIQTGFCHLQQFHCP